MTNKSMERFTFNGSTVWYKRTGAGTPIIFLHNAGSDHHIWDYQIDYFKSTHEIFAIDLLGYGRSDKPHCDYSLDLYTDMLTTLIESCGLHQVILIGQCIGGAIAVNYTLNHPENVRALIGFNVASEKNLLDGSYGFLYRLKKLSFIRKAMVYMAPKITLPDWYITLELNKQYGAIGEKDATFTQHMKSLNKQDGHLRVLNNLLMHFESFQVIDNPSKPKDFPPAMIVWGRENKILRLRGGEVFASRFNFDKTVVVDQCGHLVMREKPDEINRCLEAFID